MFKKLFFIAAAAAAVSVPLAGAAWATPSNNNPPGQGATGPGIPNEAGGFLDSVGANPNGKGNPVPPGQEFNVAKDLFKGPGVSTPDAVGDFVNAFYGPNTNGFGSIPPGQATKSFTPGCGSGHTASDGPGGVPEPICH
jgi:hypothetical protein